MSSLLLQPLANPRMLVCEVQGGDAGYKLNGLILTCAFGAAYSHSNQCRKQRLDLSKCAGLTLADTKSPSSCSIARLPSRAGERKESAKQPIG